MISALGCSERPAASGEAHLPAGRGGLFGRSGSLSTLRWTLAVSLAFSSSAVAKEGAARPDSVLVYDGAVSEAVRVVGAAAGHLAWELAPMELDAALTPLGVEVGGGSHDAAMRRRPARGRRAPPADRQRRAAGRLPGAP